MKNNKGITLIALSITIIILLIIASITIFYGKESIEKANLESLKTNMYLIKAKAKEYCEEANFMLGTGEVPSNPTKFNEYIEPAIKYLKNGTNEAEDTKRPMLSQAQNVPEYVNYKEFVAVIDLDDLKVMGLKDVENPDKYLIGFDITKNKVEVYYTDGYESNGETKYALSDIEDI